MNILYETENDYPAMVRLTPEANVQTEAERVVPEGSRFILTDEVPEDIDQERWRVDYDTRTLSVTAPLPPEAWEVNAERDRRLRSGFTQTIRGNEMRFDSDETSIKRITGAASLAGFAIGAGAPQGYYRWHGGDMDFAWITQDNGVVPLDAHETLELGKKAANWESQHVFAAHILKSFPEVPQDFTDDKYWS